MNLNSLFEGKSDEEIVYWAGRIETWARNARELIVRKRAFLEFAQDLSEQTRAELETKHTAVLEANKLDTDAPDLIVAADVDDPIEPDKNPEGG